MAICIVLHTPGNYRPCRCIFGLSLMLLGVWWVLHYTQPGGRESRLVIYKTSLSQPPSLMILSFLQLPLLRISRQSKKHHQEQEGDGGRVSTCRVPRELRCLLCFPTKNSFLLQFWSSFAWELQKLYLGHSPLGDQHCFICFICRFSFIHKIHTIHIPFI